MIAPTDPRISVVIPTFNRPARLLACLDALAAQTMPREQFEIIVVNDGGIALAPELVRERDTRVNLRVFNRAHRGPAAARNLGVHQARGSVIAFTDDDCRPHRDWLIRIAMASADRPNAAIGGLTINALPSNVYSTATQMFMDAVYSYFNRPGREMTFASNNLAVSRDRFLEIGGFDERFAFAAQEDRDLCDRWLSAGHPLWFDPSMQVDHAHALTLTAYARQHFTYGRGARVFHISRRQRRLDPVTPDPGYYLHLLLAPWRQPSTGRAPVLAALNVLAIAMNALGHAWERVHPRDPRRSMFA
jgi:glycosyltransferase involved in cell wall biosynthesis